jgi:hypothetical protein
MDGFKEFIKYNALSNEHGLRKFVALTVIDEVCRRLPSILQAVQGVVCRPRRTSLHSMHITKRPKSIVIEHVVDGKGREPIDELGEAVLRHVTSCVGVTDLRYAVGRYLLDFEESFEVAAGISCTLLTMDVDRKNGDLSLSMKLSSATKTIREMRGFVESCKATYRAELRNKLGDQFYLFDQTRSAPGRLRYDPGNLTDKVEEDPGKLQFVKHKFTTSRNFENIFYTQRNAVRDRVRFFLDNPDWYRAKGIPHTLGLLLHGPPGTGKSSTVKAIARVAGRHIVNVNMSQVKTKSQLVQLFYEDTLYVVDKEGVVGAESYSIPIDKRVYVLEDIDAMTNEVVLERTACVKTDSTTPTLQDALTLSDLLNVLDGVLEQPGRILIMSTNHVSMLDKALIRPGRVDMIVEFTHATAEMVCEMYESFFERPFPRERIRDVVPDTHTPAEVSAMLFRHFGKPEDAVEALCLPSSVVVLDPNLSPVTKEAYHEPRVSEIMEPIHPKELLMDLDVTSVPTWMSVVTPQMKLIGVVSPDDLLRHPGQCVRTVRKTAVFAEAGWTVQEAQSKLNTYLYSKFPVVDDVYNMKLVGKLTTDCFSASMQSSSDFGAPF